VPPIGIDIVRLRNIAFGLKTAGFDVEILAPEPSNSCIKEIPVRSWLNSAIDSFDLLKTCYHQSIQHVGDFSGPIISRIVRVVDEKLPERDEAIRSELLQCQELIRSRARVLVLNNEANAERWRKLYGGKPAIHLAPTGCPATLPQAGANPYDMDSTPVVFLGSIAAPRILKMINDLADAVEGIAQIHLVGKNKSRLYGKQGSLNPRVLDHAELPEDKTWAYLAHAKAGLAFSTGPHVFDNDLSKIYSYLRAGLPVLSEQGVLNNDLIDETQMGEIFRYGDIEDLVVKTKKLLSRQYPREQAMAFMSRNHSWDCRVESYAKLFRDLTRRMKSKRGELSPKPVKSILQSPPFVKRGI
jgi:glycosyltransferase involved in cell wall biosynthesis